MYTFKWDLSMEELWPLLYFLIIENEVFPLSGWSSSLLVLITAILITSGDYWKWRLGGATMSEGGQKLPVLVIS